MSASSAGIACSRSTGPSTGRLFASWRRYGRTSSTGRSPTRRWDRSSSAGSFAISPMTSQRAPRGGGRAGGGVGRGFRARARQRDRRRRRQPAGELAAAPVHVGGAVRAPGRRRDHTPLLPGDGRDRGGDREPGRAGVLVAGQRRPGGDSPTVQPARDPGRGYRAHTTPCSLRRPARRLGDAGAAVRVASPAGGRSRRDDAASRRSRSPTNRCCGRGRACADGCSRTTT